MPELRTTNRIMKKTLTLITLMLIGISQVNAQKFFTRTGNITFFSTTPMEDIKAENHQAGCILNMENGEVAFTVMMKSFEFEKALMQEHFNEKYVESDKFPKATFKGVLQVKSMDTFAEDGEYPVAVDGSMTIHGVTKPMEARGTLTRKGESITVNAVFPIVVEEYDIKIPGPVKDKIAKAVETTVNAELKPLKK